MRKRIQESSYIQEQYVLTHCSLSSEQSLQTHSHSHIQASSNSDSAGGVFLPDPHSSGSVMDTGSLPQGLEKMPPPEQRSSLSRWADTVWSQNLSGETDSSAEKVRDGQRNQDFLMSQITAFQKGLNSTNTKSKNSLFFNHQSELLDRSKESHRRHKALVRSTMAARSFSSPQGELEMHRLRRALERVSFDQTLGGRLDESDGETKPPSRGTLSYKSFTDSSEFRPQKECKKNHVWLTPIFPHPSVRWTHVPRFSAGLGHLHRPRIPLHGRST